MSNTAPILLDEALWDKPWAERIDILSNTRKNIFTLTGICVDIMRGYYANPTYLPKGLCRKWTNEPNSTQIWIDSLTKFNDANPEFRPAILVQIAGIQFSTQAMRRDGLMGGNLPEAERYYTRTGNGTVHFIHIADKEAEAMLLAAASEDYLTGLAPVLAQDYCFDTFEVASYSASTYISESRERVRNVVSCQFAYTDTWLLKQESLKLKGAIIRTGQNLFGDAIVSP